MEEKRQTDEEIKERIFEQEVVTALSLPPCLPEQKCHSRLLLQQTGRFQGDVPGQLVHAQVGVSPR